MSQIVPVSRSAVVLPALVAASGGNAGIRFLEFFAAQISNPHTRRAYSRAVGEFLAWCESVGVTSLAAVRPLHVAAWIEMQGREISAPSVKQQLAAIRHLFDWLVIGHIVDVNPAASVRGPRHWMRSGKAAGLEGILEQFSSREGDSLTLGCLSLLIRSCHQSLP